MTNDFHLSGGGKGDALTLKELLHLIGQETTSELNFIYGVRNLKTFEYGNSAGDTIPNIANETGSLAGGVESHDTRESNVDVLGVEGLEHNSGHLFSVLLGVTGGLSN
jgi:hypothetical protein